MSASALPGFLDALSSALRSRAGLVGVNVFTCPVDPADLGPEAIQFAASVSIEQEQAAMSSSDISETFDVPANVVCFTTLVNDINTAAKTVRDRAFAILEEVVDELAGDRTVDASVLDAEVNSVTMTQGMAPECQLGRWCNLEFTISAEAHTTP